MKTKLTAFVGASALVVGAIIVGAFFETIVSYLFYNYFVAPQLHLPTGTFIQVLAAITLRNLIFVPLIQVAKQQLAQKD